MFSVLCTALPIQESPSGASGHSEIVLKKPHNGGNCGNLYSQTTE